MEKTKVISVRMYVSTLAKLDEFTAKTRYWKRNAIIEQMVSNLLEYASYDDIMKLVRQYDHDKQGLKIHIEKIQEL